MKRVLIITYYWPPSGGSGVQRWVKFAKYLPSMGFKPVIYTPENPEMTSIDHSLYEDIPKEAEIIKRHITEFYWLYRLLKGRRRGQVKEENPISGGKKTLMQKIMLAIRGNVFIPDPRITWRRSSVRFLRKYLEENPVDVIVSTGPPHSMHLIAKDLSEEISIPWVADFRDPWTKMFNFKYLPLLDWAKKKHGNLEKAVLDKADFIVSVSPSVAKDFQNMTETPVELITNGYDEDDFQQVVEEDGYFNITHTGLLVAGGNPELLWKLIAQKCRRDEYFDKMVKIRLCGRTDKEVIDSINAAGLGEKTINLGYQSHNVAVREQKNASVLILPLRMEPETTAILPGKLFEYMAARKPILCIGLSEGDMADVLKDTGSGKAFDWDDEGMGGFIDSCWESFKQGEDSSEDLGIDKYSRKTLTAQMASLLKKVSEKDRYE